MSNSNFDLYPSLLDVLAIKNDNIIWNDLSRSLSAFSLSKNPNYSLETLLDNLEKEFYNLVVRIYNCIKALSYSEWEKYINSKS